MGRLYAAPGPFEAGGVGLGFAQGVCLLLQLGNAGFLRLGLTQRGVGAGSLGLGTLQGTLGPGKFAALAVVSDAGALGGVKQRQHPGHLPGAAGPLGSLAHALGAAFLHGQAAGGVLAVAPDFLLFAQALQLGSQFLALLEEPLGVGVGLLALGAHGGGGFFAHPGVLARQHAAQTLRLVLEVLHLIGGEGLHLLHAAHAGKLAEQFLALPGLAVEQRGELALRQHHAAGEGVEIQPHHVFNALRDVLLRAAAQAGPFAVRVEAVESHLVVGLFAPARAGDAVGLPARLEGQGDAERPFALRNQRVEPGGAEPRRFAVERESHRVEQAGLAAASRPDEREQFEVGKIEVGGLPEGGKPAQGEVQRLHCPPSRTCASAS